jgi:hypothetical protein
MDPIGKTAEYGSLSQGGDPSAQGDTATVDQQQQQEGETSPPLTDTIQIGLQSIEERRQQLHGMVRVRPRRALLAVSTCALGHLRAGSSH